MAHIQSIHQIFNFINILKKLASESFFSHFSKYEHLKAITSVLFGRLWHKNKRKTCNFKNVVQCKKNYNFLNILNFETFKSLKVQ